MQKKKKEEKKNNEVIDLFNVNDSLFDKNGKVILKHINLIQA